MKHGESDVEWKISIQGIVLLHSVHGGHYASAATYIIVWWRTFSLTSLNRASCREWCFWNYFWKREDLALNILRVHCSCRKHGLHFAVKVSWDWLGRLHHVYQWRFSGCGLWLLVREWFYNTPGGGGLWKQKSTPHPLSTQKASIRWFIYAQHIFACIHLHVLVHCINLDIKL